MKKDRLYKEIEFYYDCGICETVRHSIKVIWNKKTLGEEFPKFMMERSVIKHLKNSFTTMHPKTEFDERKIKVRGPGLVNWGELQCSV